MAKEPETKAESKPAPEVVDVKARAALKSLIPLFENNVWPIDMTDIYEKFGDL